jgi:hypothetical protein
MIYEGMLFPAAYDRDQYTPAEEAAHEWEQWQDELRADEQFVWEQQNAWLMELPEAYGIDWQEVR